MTCRIWASQPLRGKGMMCKGILYYDKNNPWSSIKKVYRLGIKHPHTAIFTGPKVVKIVTMF